MPCCAAFGCSRKDTQQQRDAGISFHKFPHKNRDLLQKWLQNLRRDNYVPSPTAVLCSEHFESHQFYKGERRRLLHDTVPTKFDFPKHLQKDSKLPRKPPKPRTQDSSSTLCTAVEISTQSFTEAGPSSDCISGPLDHTYHVSVVSPRKLKKRLEESMDINDDLQKRLKVSQQKVRRLEQKITTVQDVISALKEKGLLSNGCEGVLERISGAPKQILERALNGKFGSKNDPYPDELRTFALTLQFYSTKAYNYVRETFGLALPHPSVIRRWYSTIPDSAGFTPSAFSALAHKVKEAESEGTKVMVAIMLDEMTIRKHVRWDGKQFRGYVDMGTDDFDDSAPLANDALVIMAVSINDGGKFRVATS